MLCLLPADKAKEQRQRSRHSKELGIEVSNLLRLDFTGKLYARRLLVHTLSPEGELLHPRHGEHRDDEDGHRRGIPPCAGTSLYWFSVATEASGGGTPDLLCSPIVLGHMEIYRRKKYVRGATRGPRGWRAHPGEWAHPLPRGFLVASLTWTPSLPGGFPSKNNFSS